MIALRGKDVGTGISLSALWQRRNFLFVMVAGALIVAGLLLAVIAPVYTSEALVSLTMRNTEVLDRQAMTPTPPSVSQVQTEMEVIRSRHLVGQVVDQLQLTQDPEFNKSLASKSVVKTWIKDVMAQAMELLPEDLRAEKKAPSEAMIRSDTIDEVLKKLAIFTDAESFAIHVSFRAETPEKAANVANAFADIYVLGLLKNKYDDIERATAWVSKQIDTLQGQVNAAAAEAAAYRQAHNLGPLAADPGLMASNQISNLTTELGQAEQARVDADLKLRQAQGWLKNPDELPSVDLVAQSPFVQSLRAQEAVLLARLAEMNSKYQSDHPAVVGLREQLTSMRRSIGGEVQKVVQALGAQAAQAHSREAVIRQRMDEISGRANKNAAPLAELGKRQRDLEVKTAMLATFMTRYNEIANRMEVEKPDARVVSRAMEPTSPTQPKPILFLGIAFIGSLGLGATLVTLLERFRPGYFTTTQVRDELGLPTLGVVPNLPRLGHRMGPSDYMIQKPTSMYSEAIKAAQLAILDAQGTRGSRRILVASSVPGEGKTSFAISLARSLAASGYRTLLIDCDLRRPAVHRHFDGKAGPGLTDVISQSVSLDDAVRHDKATGLFYLLAGTRTEDPQRVLSSPGASTLIEAAGERFDIIIIDSPPTMVASDSAVLAKSTDLVLYMVAWDKTPRAAVSSGIEYLQSHGGNVAGVVLSKVDFNQARSGDYVGYAFRYGNYYAK